MQNELPTSAHAQDKEFEHIQVTFKGASVIPLMSVKTSPICTSAQYEFNMFPLEINSRSTLCDN